MSKKPSYTPKSDSKFTARNKPKVEWQGYVNFEVQKTHKAALDAMVKAGNDPLLWLPKIAADGVYEVKAKWDTYNNCWVASLYCAKHGHESAGWALPCRASDYWDALRRLAFVHVEVLHESWSIGANDFGWDDEKW